MIADTVVRSRINAQTKRRATIALESMGLSISDAIRLLMLKIADEQRLPFDVKAPNKITRRALEEVNNGKGKQFRSKSALLKDLGL